MSGGMVSLAPVTDPRLSRTVVEAGQEQQQAAQEQRLAYSTRVGLHVTLSVLVLIMMMMMMMCR
jgi:hypothetical protein